MPEMQRLAGKIAESLARHLFDARSKGRPNRNVEVHLSEKEFRAYVEAAIQLYEKAATLHVGAQVAALAEEMNAPKA
jgi:hypothetical protein